MAQTQFRLHSDFRLIETGRPGENTPLLTHLAQLIEFVHVPMPPPEVSPR